MIDFELPCCGEATRLAELADEVRCDGCGVVVELAPDAPVARDLTATFVAALAA